MNITLEIIQKELIKWTEVIGQYNHRFNMN